MASPQFQALFQFLKANPTPPGIPVVQQRQTAEAMAAQTPLPDDVYSEPITGEGVAGLLLAAPGADDQKIILYLHGGGYALGSSAVHRDFGWRLSAAAGARVFLLDYALAPERPFPTAVHDTTRAYQWLLTNGFAPANIAIGGDSAGGGLAVAALLALRDDGVELPKTAVLLSPWLDLTQSGSSIEANAANDPLLNRARLDEFAAWYLGETDPRSPLASPLYAELSGLPRTLIQVSAAEILLDDALRFADKAQAAGVAVTLDIWEEMTHVWQGLAAVVPEGQQALDQIGAFISQEDMVQNKIIHLYNFRQIGRP